MLDVKIIEEYEKIEELIYDAAQDILAEIHAIKPIEGFKHLSFSKLEDSYIEYFGEDSWQYSGYESYEHSLPSKLLFDKEFKENYINKLKEEVSEKNRIQQERDEKAKQDKLAKEKSQYEELKAKFEGE